MGDSTVTADPAPTDPAPPAAPAPAGPADVPDPSVPTVRLAGGVLGFLLAVPAVVVAHAIGAAAVAVAAEVGSPATDSFITFDVGGGVLSMLTALSYVFEQDGIASGSRVGVGIAWLVGPVAAFVVGTRLAPAAARRTAPSGIWMGALTYLGALVFAPLATAPVALGSVPAFPDEPTGAARVVNFVVSLPILWILASVILAPLLVICVVAGSVWSRVLPTVLDRIKRGTISGVVAGTGMPLWPLVAGGGLIAFGWLGLALLFGSDAGMGGPGGAD